MSIKYTVQLASYHYNLKRIDFDIDFFYHNYKKIVHLNGANDLLPNSLFIRA